RLRGGKVERVVPTARIGDILVDRDGSVWAATRGLGVLRVTPGGAASLMSFSDSTVDDVAGLLEDREGNIWVADRQGRVVLREAPSARLSRPEGLSGRVVERIFEDRDGAMWVATENALDRITGGRVEPVDIKPLGATGRVYALARDRDGRLWIGADGGLFQL